MMYRRGNVSRDQPNMGHQSAHVHDETRRTERVSQLVACVAFSSFVSFNDLTFGTDGLSSVYRTEGVRGLYRGASLAVFGVCNEAVQFMAYEKMKKWAFDRRRRKGMPMDKLVRLTRFYARLLFF